MQNQSRRFYRVRACLIWGNTGTTLAAVRPLGGISKRHTTLPVMRFIVCIALAIAAQLLLVRRYSEIWRGLGSR